MRKPQRQSRSLVHGRQIAGEEQVPLFFSRMANLTGEAQESTKFYGKRSHLLADCK